MIEGGGRTRFLLEPTQAIGIGAQTRWKHLDGDVTTKARVPRAVDLAHPAGPDGCEDFARADVPTDQVADAVRWPEPGSRDGGGLAKEIRGRVRCEQGLDVVPQVRIARTGVGEERGAVGYLARERLIVEPQDPFLAIGCHGRPPHVPCVTTWPPTSISGTSRA